MKNPKFRKHSRLYQLTVGYYLLYVVLFTIPFVFFLGGVLLFPLYVVISLGGQGEDAYAAASNILTAYVIPALFWAAFVTGLLMAIEAVKRFRATADSRLRQKIILIVGGYVFLSGSYVASIISNILGVG